MVGIPEDRIILMGEGRDETALFKHFSNVRNISGASRYRRSKVDPRKDLAFLVYSSGTTGHPKGVMLSHENIVSNVMQGKVGEGGNLSWEGGTDNQGDKILAFLPFFHIYVGFFLSDFWRQPNNLTGPNLPVAPIDVFRPGTYHHAQIRP